MPASTQPQDSLSGLVRAVLEVSLRTSIFMALLIVFSSAMYSRMPAPALQETPTSDSSATPPLTNSNPPPKARVVEATEDYFGTRLVDPYRWMESGGDELKQWMTAQGAYTDRVLPPSRAASNSQRVCMNSRSLAAWS